MAPAQAAVPHAHALKARVLLKERGEGEAEVSSRMRQREDGVGWKCFHQTVHTTTFQLSKPQWHSRPRGKKDTDSKMLLGWWGLRHCLISSYDSINSIMLYHSYGCRTNDHMSYWCQQKQLILYTVWFSLAAQVSCDIVSWTLAWALDLCQIIRIIGLNWDTPVLPPSWQNSFTLLPKWL